MAMRLDPASAIPFALAALLGALAAGAAQSAGKAVAIPHEGLVWKESGIPGVSFAAPDGDHTAGPSHFYLKYKAGLVTPAHHHSPDHYVTTLSGTLVLTVDGAEHRLLPGSYFALLGKAAHIARCEGAQDCVMFIDARGAWDVVSEVEPPAKP